MEDLIHGWRAPAGLLTAGVLGTPEHVCRGLEASLVLPHPHVQQRKFNRDRFNLTTPATVFHLSKNGSKLIGGGIEAGLMPMGAAAGAAEEGP